MNDAAVYSPNPEDFSFSFKTIQKGYAVIAMLLNGKEQIRQALACYQKITGNGAASKEWCAENEAKRLQESLSALRKAAKFWQADPKDLEVQRGYASLVQMAYDDCQKSFSMLSEAADVLDRAVNGHGEHDGTIKMLAGIGDQEAQQALQVINRLRRGMKNFVSQLQEISVNGCMVIGAEEKEMGREMGRPVIIKKENTALEQEAMFWTITGILGSERDNILKILGEVQPKEKAESLTQAFLGVAGVIAEYAKFGIERPEAALTQLKTYIPRCIEALTEVKSHVADSHPEVIEVLLDNLTSLQNMQSRAGGK